MARWNHAARAAGFFWQAIPTDEAEEVAWIECCDDGTPYVSITHGSPDRVVALLVHPATDGWCLEDANGRAPGRRFGSLRAALEAIAQTIPIPSGAAGAAA